MSVKTIQHLLLQELETFKRELAAFPDDASVWEPRPGIANTTGTLALHCAGNLQHFIGARLGDTGFVRNRDLEFSRRAVPRVELLAELDRAVAAVKTLDGRDDASLPRVYPDPFGGKSVNTDVLLMYLVMHLAYHLGQADYHRRMTTGDGTTVDAIAARGLPPAL